MVPAQACSIHEVALVVERGAVQAFVVGWLEDGALHSIDAFPVDALDTTGAGDVFHGAFALALAEGADHATAFRFASAAAALKCTRPGARAGIPHRPDVERLLTRQPATRR